MANLTTLSGGGPVLVVTPNLCFDRTLWVEAFEAGTVSRPHRVLAGAGGKGVNVARALRCLGAQPQLAGLLPTEDGDRFVQLLADEGQSLLSVGVAGSVRVATIVVEDSGRATVFNEPGPTVGASEQAALLDRLEQAVSAEPGTVVACSGSLPPGLPDDTYGRVVEIVQRHGGVAVVDGARAALAASLSYGPDVVTPNLAEARGMIAGTTLEPPHEETSLEADREAAFVAAHGLRERGARRAVVTVGAHGVAWVDADGTERWLDAHEVRLTNPIGAGDAFVAGLVWSLALEPTAWQAAVANATAVAGAAVEHEVAGYLDPMRVVELLAVRSGAEGDRR
jgi:1-phosphofructokinase family hexose kinase